MSEVGLTPSAYYYGNPVNATEWAGLFTDDHIWAVSIAWRGTGLPRPDHAKWAICLRGYELSKAGEWVDPPTPSNRDKEWLANHRYSLEEAKMAIKKIERELVAEVQEVYSRNGTRTPQDVLREREACR